MKDINGMLKTIILNYIDGDGSDMDFEKSADLFKDFGLDSIKTVNIISDIEVLFDVSLPINESTIELLKDYNKLSAYIAKENMAEIK